MGGELTGDGAGARLGGMARRDLIVAMVSEAGFCTTAELAKALGVSEMTVRRDAGILEREARLRTVHGGVSALSGMASVMGRDYSLRAESHAAAKHAIAAEALKRLGNASVVAFDAGTTVAAVAPQFAPRTPTTVVTHSLAAINGLNGRERLTINAVGGVLHSSSQSFSGPVTVQTIGNLRVDVVLLGASGLGARGLFCGNEYDAETKRAFLEVSARVIMLSDSSKFSASAMVRACPLEGIHEAIIDDGVTDEQLAILRDAGIETTVVSTT